MVVLHDVAPQTWPRYTALLAALDRCSIVSSLLVVTDYHGGGHLREHPEFVATLQARRAQGDEIVFHGVRHLDGEPLGRWLNADAWLMLPGPEIRSVPGLSAVPLIFVAPV